MNHDRQEAERGVNDYPGEIEERIAAFAEAQVHATLYLAEQQRIANLIAYMEKLGHPTVLDQLHDQDVKDFKAAVKIVRAGLGLV